MLRLLSGAVPLRRTLFAQHLLASHASVPPLRDVPRFRRLGPRAQRRPIGLRARGRVGAAVRSVTTTPVVAVQNRIHKKRSSALEKKRKKQLNERKKASTELRDDDPFRVLPALGQGVHERLAKVQTRPDGFRFGFTEADLADQPESVRRMLSLENAAQAEVNQFRVAKAIESFRRFDGDTGSPEVQIAVLSERILYLTHHTQTHRKDVHSRRGLIGLLNKRTGMLKYLKRTDPHKYIEVIRALDIRGI